MEECGDLAGVADLCLVRNGINYINSGEPVFYLLHAVEGCREAL